MAELRWRKRNGAILPGGSVKPGKEVVLGSDAFIAKPDRFTIYRELSALMRRVREEKGKSPFIQIDSLRASESGGGPDSARSEAWTLPTPGRRIKWRLRFDDDQLHRSPVLHVSRLGTISAGLAPKAKAGIPHGPSAEVSVVEIRAEIVASVDPVVDLFVMTPWGQKDEDLYGILDEFAADSTEEGEDPGGTREALTAYLGPHLPDEPPKGWEFTLPTSEVKLAEGERAEVVVQLRAPTPGSTAFAIQMRTVDQAEPDASVSDVFIVEVPSDPANASLLFASDDDGDEPSLQGDLAELVSWGKAAAQRFIPGLR
jgi:hypothetical protein